jgi:uncharacterized cupin superfamily protein
MDDLIAIFRSAVVGAALAGMALPGIAQVVSVPAALLGHAEGGVAVAPKGDNEWTDVKPRRALQRGDRVWVDKSARAELLAGNHLLRLDGQSQVSLEAVGESTQVSLLRGSLALAVSKLAAGENVEVGTPNLALRARQPGDYRIDVDPQQGTTRVSVMSGGVVVYGEQGESIDLLAGQRVTFRDRTLAKAPMPAFTAVDEFDRWIVARGRAPALAAAAPATPTVHPDVIARMHREQEAQRQAQIKRELEQLKQAQAQAKLAPVAPPAPAPKPKLAQAPQAAPAPAPMARIEQAPRIVKVPAPPTAAVPAAAAEAKALAARRTHEERRVAQARRAQEQQRRIAAEATARNADEQRRAAAAVAAKRDQELQRRQAAALAKKAEQDRKLQLARKAEQDKRVAQAKRSQEQAVKAAAYQQAVGEARRAQLEKLQQQAMREEQATREQRTRAEQARREEEARREELARREEDAKREASERRQRLLAEQHKRDQEVWLRTQQPIQAQPYRPAPQGVPARRVM